MDVPHHQEHCQLPGQKPHDKRSWRGRRKSDQVCVVCEMQSWYQQYENSDEIYHSTITVVEFISIFLMFCGYAPFCLIFLFFSTNFSSRDSPSVNGRDSPSTTAGGGGYTNTHYNYARSVKFTLSLLNYVCWISNWWLFIYYSIDFM